jgi:hypothetical protein
MEVTSYVGGSKDIVDVTGLPSPLNYTGSINNMKPNNTRKDYIGNQIRKGSKKHKVTFVDQAMKKPLTEVFLVESYKKYNSDDSSSNQSNCCLIY